jgi:hypothetical protein
MGTARMSRPCGRPLTPRWARRRRCPSISRRCPPTSSRASRRRSTPVGSPPACPRSATSRGPMCRNGRATRPLATHSATARPGRRRRSTSSACGQKWRPEPRARLMRSRMSARTPLTLLSAHTTPSGPSPTSSTSSSSGRHTQARRRRPARSRPLTIGRSRPARGWRATDCAERPGRSLGPGLGEGPPGLCCASLAFSQRCFDCRILLTRPELLATVWVERRLRTRHPTRSRLPPAHQPCQRSIRRGRRAQGRPEHSQLSAKGPLSDVRASHLIDLLTSDDGRR